MGVERAGGAEQISCREDGRENTIWSFLAAEEPTNLRWGISWNESSACQKKKMEVKKKTKR